MIPPMRRAIENEGAFRNPMAKATPEGIHFAYGCDRRVRYAFKPARMANRSAKVIIKKELFSGSEPSPIKVVSISKTQDCS
jgi:hypothetical protein